MTDLDKATQQFSSRERRTTRIAKSVAADSWSHLPSLPGSSVSVSLPLG